MDKPLVVIPDPVHPDVFEKLKPRFRVVGGEDFARDRQAALAQADAVIPRSFKMPRKILEACPGSDYPFDMGNLDCVHRVEEIDIPRDERDSILAARAKTLLRWP